MPVLISHPSSFGKDLIPLTTGTLSIPFPATPPLRSLSAASSRSLSRFSPFRPLPAPDRGALSLPSSPPTLQCPILSPPPLRSGNVLSRLRSPLRLCDTLLSPPQPRSRDALYHPRSPLRRRNARFCLACQSISEAARGEGNHGGKNFDKGEDL